MQLILQGVVNIGQGSLNINHLFYKGKIFSMKILCSSLLLVPLAAFYHQ